MLSLGMTSAVRKVDIILLVTWHMLVMINAVCLSLWVCCHFMTSLILVIAC
jgi:hypothetical protein